MPSPRFVLALAAMAFTFPFGLVAICAWKLRGRP